MPVTLKVKEEMKSKNHFFNKLSWTLQDSPIGSHANSILFAISAALIASYGELLPSALQHIRKVQVATYRQAQPADQGR